MVWAAVVTGAAPAAAAVRFENLTVDEALRRAVTEDKLVLVDVNARWCGPCQQLDRESFVDATVAAETDAHFIALKVDGEGPGGPELMRRYHVVGFPTLLVLRPDGTEIDRVFGFLPGPDLAGTLRGFREGQGTLAQRMEEARRRPEDLELQAEVAMRAVVRGDFRTARPIVARIVREDRDNARGLASKVLFHVGRYHHLRGNESWRAALTAFDELAARYPESAEATGPAFAIDRAKALHRLGRDAEAMATLERFVGQQAGEGDRYNTVTFFLYREQWALDRAEGFGRRGVSVAPRDASMWDTLAEVQASRGHLEEAVASADVAQRLDPSAPYYGIQLARFRRMLADRSAPTP